jgi:hypothetical protein
MLDGYENPNPTTPPPAEKKVKPLVRPIPVISQRILNHINSLERVGETARHSAFVVIPSAGIWRKMGNKTFYRLFSLRYMQHNRKKNGIQEAIDTAKSRVFIKDSSYTCTTALTLQPGIGLEGESMPQLTSVDPTAPENLTFTTNANGDTGTVLTTTGNNDCFTGNLLRTVSVTNMGLSNFTNGFNLGAANKLGISNSIFARVFFSNVAKPLNLTNFQMLRLDQIYAWLPTTFFIQATNNNTNWNGGNSYWTDLFAHGCKNVNGAVQFIATAGYLNLMEVNRLQVNMQDANFGNSTTGYGLYLSGASASALCSWNRFYALNIEGAPPRTVRLEDWSLYNYIDLAFDLPAGGGFNFSLKKNATSQAPTNNMLFYTSNSLSVTCNVESDNYNNLLFTSVPLTPPTGSYPAGIIGFGTGLFGGTNFPTMFGGGSGQNFVGAVTSASLGSSTVPATIGSFSIGQTEEVEVGAEIRCSAYTSGTIQIQASFVDRGGTSRTVVLPVNNNGTLATGVTATGYFGTPTMKISTTSGNTITLATIGTFTATYTGSGFWRATG